MVQATHEDNAMLLRWDIDPDGNAALNVLPTPIPTPQGVTFMDPDDVLPSVFQRTGGSGGGV